MHLTIIEEKPWHLVLSWIVTQVNRLDPALGHMHLHKTFLLFKLKLILNGKCGVINSGPILALRRLFQSDLNNGSSPSHSNLVSDGTYIYSGLLLMVSWWVPYLPKGCRPDFNNDLVGDSYSGPVLAHQRLFESDSNNGPSRATPVLCQMKYTSVQVSYLWFSGLGNDFNSDVGKQLRHCATTRMFRSCRCTDPAVSAPARTKHSCDVISWDMLTSLRQPTIRLRR